MRVVVRSCFDVDGAGGTKAPLCQRGDGIADIHAGVEINVQLLAAALDHNVNSEVHVVGDRHVEIHVCAKKLILVVKVLGVEHVNRQNVFCFGNDINVEARWVAAKGCF